MLASVLQLHWQLGGWPYDAVPHHTGAKARQRYSRDIGESTA
jgi:hypothetical protein